MIDYNLLKTFRDRYAVDEAFKSLCHALFQAQRGLTRARSVILMGQTEAYQPYPSITDRSTLLAFVQQEASYQLLEKVFYPCRQENPYKD
jgi:hypothetical protein